MGSPGPLRSGEFTPGKLADGTDQESLLGSVNQPLPLSYARACARAHTLLILWRLLCPFQKQCWLISQQSEPPLPIAPPLQGLLNTQPFPTSIIGAHGPCQSFSLLPTSPRPRRDEGSQVSTLWRSGPAEGLCGWVAQQVTDRFWGLWSPIWTVALNSSNCVRATSKQPAKSLGHSEVKGHVQGHTAIQSWLGFEPVPVP